MSRQKVWTGEKNNFIRQNADRLTDGQLAQELSKGGLFISINAVRQQRRKLDILKENGRGKCVVREECIRRGKAVKRS